MDVQVEANFVEPFEQYLKMSKILHETIIEDVQHLIDEERRSNSRKRRDTNFNINSYHKLTEIDLYLRRVTRTNKNATLDVLGVTKEGRFIYGIKINSDKQNKKMVFIECGMHAREWISPAVCLWIIDNLLSFKGLTNLRWKQTVKKFNWYIVPMINPDGYHYSWTKNRFWRKTRAKTKNSKCFGIDGNRNWNVSWGEHATSKEPCRNNYGGSTAFSERETKALRNKIITMKRNIAVFMSLHSYGQALMIPYGFTRKRMSSYNQQLKLAKAATLAMKKLHGTSYRYGQITNVMGGTTSGSSVDWVYEKAGIQNAFVVELPDTGRHGFMLPKHKIAPTSEEVIAGIIVILNNM